MFWKKTLKKEVKICMYEDPFFFLPNTLGWVGMALFPKVLHTVTCKENDIICTANRDKLRRPLLGEAPSSCWQPMKSIAG